MKNIITHAIRAADLLALDLARITTGDATIDGLISDCIEHRRQLSNKLRHIRSIASPVEAARDYTTRTETAIAALCGEPEA